MKSIGDEYEFDVVSCDVFLQELRFKPMSSEFDDAVQSFISPTLPNDKCVDDMSSHLVLVCRCRKTEVPAAFLFMFRPNTFDVYMLGLFVEPGLRSKGLGSVCLRYAIGVAGQRE